MLTLRLHKGEEKRLREGFPWVYGGQLIESSEQVLAAPGELARLHTKRDEFLGIGTFNAQAPIAFRLLSTRDEKVDEAFFAERLARALARREKIIDVPYYRLVHAEADGMPGLTVDRYGEICVLQLSTAGMERMLPHLLAALDACLAPAAILLRNDIPARAAEGLAREVRLVKGNIPSLVEVQENGCIYYADLLAGQKTGWFFDQRDNRRLASSYTAGKSFLDIYSHSGGFGVLAARSGASKVTLVDSSALALKLTLDAARRNGVAGRMEALQGDAFDVMRKLAESGAQYEVVSADPPPFVKAREHVASGMKGYEKTARLSAALTAPGGILVIASCSHHATRARFRQAVLAGVAKAGRQAQLLHQTGAAADHPLHPHLPQSEYLKSLTLRLA